MYKIDTESNAKAFIASMPYPPAAASMAELSAELGIRVSEMSLRAAAASLCIQLEFEQDCGDMLVRFGTDEYAARAGAQLALFWARWSRGVAHTIQSEGGNDGSDK